MKFGSLFSGIGGFDLGLERAGMTCAWQSEIDPACIALLNQRFTAPLIPDCRNVTANTAEPVDLICGGFPCQDVSVAGKRAGLAGERSGLWFEFHRILSELKPAWVIVENVPGLLSSHGGRDFAVILRGLVKLRYGVAWRILDAQYFGVPQRRRRVFIVGHLGDGRAAQVLFESESVSGNPQTRRAPGAAIAPDVAVGINGSGLRGRQPGSAATMIAATLGAHHGRNDQESMGAYIFEPRFTRNGRGGPGPVTPPLKAQSGRTGKDDSAPVVAYNIQSNDGGQHKRADRPGGGMYVNETETALTVGTTDQTVIAFAWQQGVSNNDRSYPVRAGDYAGSVSGTRVDAIAFQSSQSGVRVADEHATLDGNNGSRRHNGIVSPVGVRRLTPLECERLQGFPDGWTDGQSDSARYRQLGNAVAVPVVEWIGRRIVNAEEQP